MLLLHIFFLLSLNFAWVTSRNPAGVNYQDQFVQEIILRDVEDVKLKDLANAGYDAASASVKKGTEAKAIETGMIYHTGLSMYMVPLKK